LVLHTYVLRVPYSCGVVLFFWFWKEIVFGVTYVLSVQYSCAVVSIFGCGGCWVRRSYCLAEITKLGEQVAKNTKLE
jgi:hypothetical protein